mmetsp:Transcript_16507/g.17850  ORF Transcript_16507/g.17850 Transcript_16507/m.17850 type:complete len:168 (-) Transcript_16507:841-1344(-)
MPQQFHHHHRVRSMEKIKFLDLMEPKPIGPTPSLIISNNSIQQVVSTGTTTTTTTTRVPTSPLGRGMVPSEVSDEIDAGIAQAFTMDDANGDNAVHAEEEDDDDDWCKGVVYEGEALDICGSRCTAPETNNTRLIINDDPLPINSPAAVAVAVTFTQQMQQLQQQQQ